MTRNEQLNERVNGQLTFAARIERDRLDRESRDRLRNWWVIGAMRNRHEAASSATIGRATA